MNWCVIVDHGSGPAQAYSAFDDSADDQAHIPFDEQAARGLADSINQFTQTRGHATALPLTETLQPGV